MERYFRGKLEPLADFSGALQLLDAGAPSVALEWDYKPKPDSVRHQTMVVRLDEEPMYLQPTLWLVEAGRQDLVEHVLSYYRQPPVRLLEHAVLDQPTPWLVAVTYTIQLPPQWHFDLPHDDAGAVLSAAGQMISYVAGPAEANAGAVAACLAEGGIGLCNVSDFDVAGWRWMPSPGD